MKKTCLLIITIIILSGFSVSSLASGACYIKYSTGDTYNNCSMTCGRISYRECLCRNDIRRGVEVAWIGGEECDENVFARLWPDDFNCVIY